MRYNGLWGLTILLLGVSAVAQVPDDDWAFEDAYDDQLVYLHALVNYSFDLQWQFDWERRQFASNALRVNTGSVSSKNLLTEIDLNINEQLNEKWRFQGQFRRTGLKQRPNRDEQLLLGFERSIFESSAVYVTVNPQFDKESMDVAAGYTFYRDKRAQYVRVGVLLEDVTYDTKNDLGGVTTQDPMTLQWAARLVLGNNWTVYSEGEVGSGFKRLFMDATASPDVSRHDRQVITAQLRVSRVGDEGAAWSAWVDWYDFTEAMQFRSPGFDYNYSNTQRNVAAEYTMLLREKHRLRFLLHHVRQKAKSRGFNDHHYDRTEILGGAFYEYLWPSSSATIAYALGQPDIGYRGSVPLKDYQLNAYGDKIILGWRYLFSDNAQLRVSVSHEVSAMGFGGGAIQFQMMF